MLWIVATMRMREPLAVPPVADKQRPDERHEDVDSVVQVASVLSQHLQRRGEPGLVLVPQGVDEAHAVLAEGGLEVDVVEIVGEADRFGSGLVRLRRSRPHHCQTPASVGLLLVAGEPPQERRRYEVVARQLLLPVSSHAEDAVWPVRHMRRNQSAIAFHHDPRDACLYFDGRAVRPALFTEGASRAASAAAGQ
ncbi:MAG: hypothetical protein L0L05_00700 [Yaniella sp.]|nr:hypothetical protein [Yaniella sp.]MDN6636860.1 hypothetical protein [Yaniella sp.]